MTRPHTVQLLCCVCGIFCHQNYNDNKIVIVKGPLWRLKIIKTLVIRKMNN